MYNSRQPGTMAKLQTLVEKEKYLLPVHSFELNILNTGDM